MLDAIIVGAGPAGLSAALILGRCRRNVLVVDSGRPRNAASHALHGFLSRDGIPPLELLRRGREDLRRYPSVTVLEAEVKGARCEGERFEVTLADGQSRLSRKLLLATGVVDRIPSLDGIEPLYGTSVFHCPYCDGWEVRDQPLAIYGTGRRGAGLALELTLWSRDLVLLTDGPPELGEEDLARLRRHDVAIRDDRIARLEGKGGILERVVFERGESLPRRALFFTLGQEQHSPLPALLGCEFTEKGTAATGWCESTNIPGLFVAGDASHSVQFVVVAAAEGAQAAYAINTQLLSEETA